MKAIFRYGGGKRARHYRSLFAIEIVPGSTCESLQNARGVKIIARRGLFVSVIIGRDYETAASPVNNGRR